MKKDDEKLELTLETVNNAIYSALDKFAHSTPSPKTVQMLEDHAKEDREQFKKITDSFTKIEEFMERALVVIEAYEETVSSGRRLIGLAGFITAVSGAWYILTKIFRV